MKGTSKGGLCDHASETVTNNLLQGHAGLSVAGHAEARLAGEDFASTRHAGDVPRVGNSGAVLTNRTIDATAAAKVDVFLRVNAGPGAGRDAVGYVANSLASGARQSLGAPVASHDLGVDALFP